jgi:rhamnosyltransferase subunit B
MSDQPLFLFNPIGTSGDVHPHLAVAKELQRRGVEVHLLINPTHQALANQLDLPASPLGQGWNGQELAENPRIRRPRSAWKEAMAWGAIGTMRETFALIKSRMRPGKTLVMSPAWSLGARLARETLPIRQVTALMNPVLLRSCSDPPLIPGLLNHSWVPKLLLRWQYRMLDRFFLDPILLPELHRFRRELGLPRLQRVMEKWWFSPDLVLGVFPKKLVPRATDWPIDIDIVGHTLWDPPAPTAQVDTFQAFVARYPKPVAIVPGSVGPGSPVYFQQVIAAIQRLGRNAVIFYKLDSGLPPDLPANILHCRYLPLAEALPACSAILHAGCMGTLSQALQAGIPQLVIPRVNDQPDNARRLARLGVAKVLTPKSVSLERLVKALQTLLADAEIQKACTLSRSPSPISSVKIIADRLEQQIQPSMKR